MATKTPQDKQRRNSPENFEKYYREKIIATQEKLERISVVTELLKKRYEGYEETEAFIDYLRSVEEVFTHAEKEQWSVEKTQDELIKSEIYLMAQTTGIDEAVFQDIYMEFRSSSNEVARIQNIANEMIAKYADGEHGEECRDFIMYVRDSLLVFAHTIDGDERFDEISEVKEQIIKLRMERMAADNQPPLTLLQKIYDEFVKALQAE